MKKQMTEIILTDEQMAKFSTAVRQKYPWICRKNTIYSAELVPAWKIRIDTAHLAEFKNIL